MSDAYEINPTRLTLARKRRGLTKTRLAALVGVETRTVSAWEHGEFLPSDANRINEIAAALRFPISFLVGDDLDEPSPDSASFRSFTRMTASHRNMALGTGALAFALNAWIEQQFELPAVDLPDLGRSLEPEEAADSVRQHWGLAEQPIKNMIYLLESKGVRIFSLAIDARDVDAFSVWHEGRPFVFLNTNKSAEHSRMDAAHELGHLLMHRHGAPQGQGAEQQANAFGSSFLMPRRSILSYAPKLPTVEHLIKAKKYWGVSVAALAYRLSAMRVITEWHARALFVEISKRGYRTREPEEMQRETSQILAKVFAALREEGMTKTQIAAKLGLPAEEIEALMFGLALTSVEGGGSRRGGNRAALRIVPRKTS